MTTNQIPLTSSAEDSSALGEVIKLGIDVHIEKYVGKRKGQSILFDIIYFQFDPDWVNRRSK